MWAGSGNATARLVGAFRFAVCNDGTVVFLFAVVGGVKIPGIQSLRDRVCRTEFAITKCPHTIYVDNCTFLFLL